MNNYDVIIIGAGPGGIFGAYELIEKNPDCKIAVFEAGHVNRRTVNMLCLFKRQRMCF